MKRYFWIVLLVMMAAGCGRFAEVEYLDTALIVTDRLEMKGNMEVLFRQDEMGGQRSVSYIDNNKEVLLSDNGPAHPEMNPDGTVVAFIDNDYWEVISAVMIFDSESGLQKYDFVMDQYKAKDLEWLDETRLLVVMGYAYGTVSVGGDLYLFDLETGEEELLHQAETGTEVISSFVTGDKIKLLIAQFNDDYTGYTTYEQMLETDPLD